MEHGNQPAYNVTVIDLSRVADTSIKEKIIKLYKKDKEAQIRANKKYQRELRKTLKQHNQKLKQQQDEQNN